MVVVLRANLDFFAPRQCLQGSLPPHRVALGKLEKKQRGRRTQSQKFLKFHSVDSCLKIETETLPALDVLCDDVLYDGSKVIGVQNCAHPRNHVFIWYVYKCVPQKIPARLSHIGSARGVSRVPG